MIDSMTVTGLGEIRGLFVGLEMESGKHPAFIDDYQGYRPESNPCLIERPLTGNLIPTVFVSPIGWIETDCRMNIDKFLLQLKITVIKLKSGWILQRRC